MIRWFFAAPRRAHAFICMACIAMLGYGAYLQHVQGLEPCPMCVVQRYAFILVAAFAGLASLTGRRGLQRLWGALGIASCAAGGFTAARQSWLQWHPPEFVSCGRDIYGMIEAFPLQRVLPMIFRGSGDCTAIDWTFLGLSIANWSFLVFVGTALVLLVLLFWRVRQP